MENNSVLGRIVIVLTGIPQYWGLLLGVIEKMADSVFSRELGKFARREPCWVATEVAPKPAKKTGAINWRKVYKALGMKFVPGNLAITADPNFWDVYVMKGVTPNMVVATLRKLGVDVNTNIDNLDTSVLTNDRTPTDGSYRVRFKKIVEADSELADKSADDLKSENISGITLLERLLLELGYFLAIGEHLDVENVTLCSGSRNSDGNVPSVDWNAGNRRLYIGWYNQQYRYQNLRARAVVS